MNFDLGGGAAMTDYNTYNEDLKSNYFKYKQIFEDATRLSPQEQLFVQKHHLEDKLATINYDFWRHVNSIVTCYFDIIKLLQKKREMELEINRIWCSKLSSTYNVPSHVQEEQPVSVSTSVWNNVGPASSMEHMSSVALTGLRMVPTIEDRVMRFKVASVFSPDLVKTIHRSIFSTRNDQVLPGPSNLKQLEKEAKWFRSHKRELEAELEKLGEQKTILAEKITYIPPTEQVSTENYNKMKSVRNLFKFLRVMNYS